MECPNCKNEMEYVCDYIAYRIHGKKWYCESCEEFVEIDDE